MSAWTVLDDKKVSWTVNLDGVTRTWQRVCRYTWAVLYTNMKLCCNNGYLKSANVQWD